MLRRLIGSMPLLSALVVRSQRRRELSDGVTAEALDRARAIVDAHGEDSLAPFVTRPDKRLCFAAGGVLGYRVIGETAVVSGDPVGPDGSAGEVVERFVARARGGGLRVAMYGCSDRHLEAYRRLGLRAVRVGEEAVVDPARFTLEGRAVRKLRQSVHRLERRGWRVAAFTGREIDAALEAEIDALEAAWRAERSRVLGFAMSLAGFHPGIRPDDLYLLAWSPEGRLRGMMRFLSHRGKLSLDAMRRVGETPNGLNEALVCRALAAARERGIREVSLNYAGLAHLVRGQDGGSRLARWLAPVVLKLLGGHFQMARLVRFNEKFSPEWRPRYLVYQGRLGLPRAAVRVLQAEGYLRRRGGALRRTRVRAARAAVATASAAVTALGLAGAYSYGQDYNVHRGFATVQRLRRAGSGRLLAVSFYSHALDRDADYLVYLPPHYDPRRRYPVDYMLHGAPGKPRVFVDIANMDVRLDNQLTLGRVKPMILVYPDGRIGGSTFSDSEWANTPAGDYESYVVDVMHNVDRHFSTLARRQDRVIGGFSEGGYGAMNIALHHVGDFANVQAWSGYYVQSATGVFSGAGAEQLVYNSPLDYAARLRGVLRHDPLRVYMFVGRDDEDSVQQPAMAEALRAAGAEVQTQIERGGHDWSVWYPQLNGLLDQASAFFARPPASHVRTRARPGRAAAAAAPAAASAAPPGVRVRVRAPGRPAPARRRRHPGSELRLLGALLLALLSALLINLGFVLQQRGHARAHDRGRAGVLGAFRTPTWLAGQAVGWVGFGGQVVAVALAPLTLVQAFAAGSLALSVPLAAWIFGQRVQRAQLVAIGVIAVSLVALPVGFSGGHGHLHDGLLIGCVLAALLAGGLPALRGSSAIRAIAAGAFYGAADAAIKAEALALHAHGARELASGWTLMAAGMTFAGFLAFQAALREDDAVRPLSLMNAFTAICAMLIGVAAFGEPLGSGTAAGVAHALAVALVLVCVRPLVAAQQRLAAAQTLEERPPATLVATAGEGADARGQAPRPPAPARAPGRERVPAVARLMLSGGALVACSGAAVGLIYGLRGLQWLDLGPSIADSLPLLQLAGFDGQPAARVIVACLLAGAALGVALVRVAPARRAVVVAVPAALVLLIASDASYALARNLRFGHVLLDRSPGAGPWVETALLVAGCWLPRAGFAWRAAAARVTGLLPGGAPARTYRGAGPVVVGAIAAAAVAVALLAGGGHLGPAAGAGARGAAGTGALVAAGAGVDADARVGAGALVAAGVRAGAGAGAGAAASLVTPGPLASLLFSTGSHRMPVPPMIRRRRIGSRHRELPPIGGLAIGRRMIRAVELASTGRSVGGGGA